MNTRQIPLIVMLSAGAIVRICTKAMNYELETALWILLAVLVVFYIAGCVIKRTLDAFEAERLKAEKEQEEVSDEGEVIEKDAAEDTEGSGAEAGTEESARE